jgi:hypothetical protein
MVPEAPGPAEDLRNAQHIAFDWVPRSPEALRLAEELVAFVVAHEQRVKPRQRARRAGDTEELLNAVGRFAGSLAVECDAGDRPALACPKDQNCFIELPVNYRPFRAAYDAFRHSDPPLITFLRKGKQFEVFPETPEWGASRVLGGYRERIEPTEAFVALLRAHGIAEGTAAAKHFEWTGKVEPVVLRAAKTKRGKSKVVGASLPIPDTDHTRRLAAEVEELTGFALATRVAEVAFAGWTRIFAEGDKKGFAWDRGGRLYAKPSRHSYQSLNDTKRAAILLGGEPVVELDLQAAHLTIVYALRGQSLADELAKRGLQDAYVIPGPPRAVVKSFVTVTLGAGKLPFLWPEDTQERLSKKKDLDQSLYPIASVSEAVLKVHPVLGDLTGITWARLQFLESEAILRTMLRLKREHEVPALTVHDSLIVPRSTELVTRAVLAEEFAAVVGQRPILPATESSGALAA